MSLAYEEKSGLGLPEDVRFAPERMVEMMAEARLARSPYHELSRVWCRFGEGVLTLRGRVSTYYLKQVAQHTVRQIDGVTQIDNRLRVA
jgi:osmotically-inducible protein OsmY